MDPNNKTHTCKVHGPMTEDNFYPCKQKSRHGKPTVAWRCKTCKKAERKKRYHDDPKSSMASTNAWKASHREQTRKTTNDSYHRNKERYLPRYRDKRVELKLQVMSYYSGGIPRCSLCGESHHQFLVLDHVEHNGADHRRELGPRHCGNKFYLWIISQAYPSGFRVLCHNCNFKECLRYNLESFESKLWEKTHGTRIINGKNYPVDLKKQSIADKKYKDAIRLECLVQYSSIIPSCVCCGSEDQEVLSIDHIDGEGREHRKSVTGNGNRFYAWLRNQNFPPGYQVLCLNCNFAHGAYKICPHKTETSGVAELTNLDEVCHKG